jgi:hypothetical protein
MDYLGYWNKIKEKNSFKEKKETKKSIELLSLYQYMFYFSCDPSKIEDVVDSHFDIDKIQAIVFNDLPDDPEIDILHSVYIEENNKFSLDYIYDSMQEIKQTFLTNYKTSSNTEFKQKLKDIGFTISKKVNIIIITNFECSLKFKDQIKDIVDSFNEENDKIQFRFVDGNEVKRLIKRFESSNESIKEGFLILSDKRNVFYFGDENSAMTIIRASSLKQLFFDKRDNQIIHPLISYNLETFEVYERIVTTIKKKSDYFNYLNKGITIICEDYLIEQDKLIIKDFNIIDGGITATAISNNIIDDDFDVTIKLIKKGEKFNSKDNLMMLIESINNQRYFRIRDSLAFRKDQIALKDKLLQSDIYLKNNRGDFIDLSRFSQSWQITSVEELSQLSIAFNNQTPSVSKTKKHQLARYSKYYKLAFNENINVDLYKDLLYIKHFYNNWLIKKDVSNFSMRSLLWVFVSVFGIISKINSIPSFLDLIKNEQNVIKLEYFIESAIITHRLFKNDAFDLENKLYQFFDLVYEKIIIDSFKGREDSLNDREQSSYLRYINFLLRSDEYYRTYILSAVFDLFFKESEDSIRQLANQIFYKVSEKERSNNLEYLNKIKNELNVDFLKKLNESEEYFGKDLDLYLELRNFALLASKRDKIRSYLVINKSIINEIIDKKPKRIEDLANIKGFGPKKVERYGLEILKIIKDLS